MPKKRAPNKILVHDEDSKKDVLLDTIRAQKWGPVEYGDQFDPVDCFYHYSVEETLYQLPNGSWTLVTGRCHFELGKGDLSAQRLSAEDAAQWLVENAFELPADLSHLEEEYTFQLGEPMPEQQFDVREFANDVVKAIEEMTSVEPGSGTPHQINDHEGTSSARQFNIPPEDRTCPMSYRRAAKLMGKGNSKDAAEWLAASVKDGSIPCEHITRQSHVFSKQSFPKTVWDSILPYDSETGGELP